MTWAKRYALRNVAFGVTRSAADYGSGPYGGQQAFGQEATDPLPNVQYVLAADPGEWPSTTGWVFRTGDAGVTFRAFVLGLDGVLSLTPVTSAALVLHRVSQGPEVALAFLVRRPSLLAIPKAASADHAAENAAAGDFALTDDDVAAIEGAFPLGRRPRSLPMI